MKISRLFGLFCLACLPFAAQAQVNGAVRALHLLPAPKQVHLGTGRFVVKPTTVILISNSQDRIAAEMLQKEILERGGLRLSIQVVTGAPKATGNISLERQTDRSW